MYISELAKESGISVRTLHHYDAIGLLKPDGLSDSGYRIYGPLAIKRLQQILFYKEMDLELAVIKRLLDDPQFDEQRTLTHHKEILQLKRDRLDGLLTLIDQILKGEPNMSIKEFDMSAIKEHEEKYAQEAEEKYGDTDAYKESRRRTGKYTAQDWARIQAESEEIYQALAERRQGDFADPEVQELIGQWQDHISRWFYPCSKEMLQGLGLMYVQDERFKENIDKYGEGLTEFISDAIAYYCDDRP